MTFHVPPDSDFSLANIPFGIFSTNDDPTSARRAGTRVGDFVIDLALMSQTFEADLYSELDSVKAFTQPTLNGFAALGNNVVQRVRVAVQEKLEKYLQGVAEFDLTAIIPEENVTMHLPMEVGDYTDFYAGQHHAERVGSMFRPNNPLMPNYKKLPVGYHGRASSILVSGSPVPIYRPQGQFLDPGTGEVVFGKTRKLDFELELGCFIGRGNVHGKSVPVDEAHEYIFGYVLLNDWSARDIQSWEYQPLGPFNGKNFATTISPWVVTPQALEPYMEPSMERDRDVLAYLKERRQSNVLNMNLEVEMMASGGNGQQDIITRTSARHVIWSFPQMIAHHTVGGCPLRTGDLLGSGTISGPEAKAESGSLLELSVNGKEEVEVSGAMRTFLQDGDIVTFRGAAGAESARVGFGVCTGSVKGSFP